MRAVKQERHIGLLLFGLVFFGIGLGFIVLSIIPTLYDSWRMAAWPSTQASLTSARLISSTSDGSTTFRIEARYRYRVEGMEYNGDRVAINSGGDNIGVFQKKLGQRLERYHRNNMPVTLYYDPNNPADALLDRTLRWPLLGFKLIFVLVFGGVGLAIMIYAWRGKRTIDTPETKGKPWLQRPEWADNQIRSSARSGLYMIWGFALLWNLISSPGAIMIGEIWQKEGMLALLVLIFPAIGLMLLWWAIRKSLEWRRFGVTPLRLNPFPGSIGGDVGGEILLNFPYDPKMVVEVSLSSLYSYVSGSGKNRSRRERVEWQDSGYAKVERGAKGCRLRFRFAVPEGLRPSEEHSESYYLWRLNIRSELPGVDLDRDFEIPVYATAEQSSGLALNSAEERPQGIAHQGVESLLPLRREGHRLELFYPVLRRPISSLMGVIFGSVFAGAGIFLWGEAQREGGMLYFMSSIFSLVGGLIVVGALYSALNSLQVELNGQRIRTVRRLLGFPIKSKEVGYHEVRSVEEKRGSTSSQQGKKHRIEYKVVALTSSGELLLAELLDSHSKAKRVTRFFQEQLNLSGE